MNEKETAYEPAISTADRGELVSLMEPLLVGESSRQRTAPTEVAVELAAKSAGFRRSVPAVATRELTP